MTHIVGKLTWNITCAQQENASAATQEASLLANSATLAKAIEAWCDKHNTEQNWQIFDLLVLDLGTISGEDWPQKLKTSLLEAFEKAAKKTPNSQGGAVKIVNSAPTTQTAKTLALQAFYYFLLRGMLHPSLPANVRSVADVLLYVFFILKNESPAETRNFVQQLAKNQEAQQRLLGFQLNEVWRVFVENIISSKTKSKLWLLLFLDVDNVLNQSKIAGQLQRETWQKLAWTAIFQEVIAATSTEKQIENFLHKMFAAATKSKDAKLARTAQSALKLLPELVKASTSATIKKQTHVGKKDEKEALATDLDNGKADELAKPERAAAHLFVRNAGFVLVAPWLPKFFQLAGVAEKGKIIAPEKALRLLEYLDMGDEKQRAADVTLYRFLIGLSVDEKMYPTKHITEKEMAACHDLMTSMIAAWQALKNTTPHGLREGFFWREGILKNADTQPLLLVEQKGQDVLLSFLPWGIGLIKLPWMPKPLTVNWG